MKGFVKTIIDDFIGKFWLAAIFGLIVAALSGEDFTMGDFGKSLVDFIIVDIIVRLILLGVFRYKNHQMEKDYKKNW